MNDITVLIPVSPIPSHPSTEVLEETIQSIRDRLPDSEIIVMFDGVPAWNEQYREAYESFTHRMLWKCEHEYGNVTPLVFDKHSHQSLMVKEGLKLVRTPLILFSEQDTPLTGEIPFEGMGKVITTGYANLIRLHHEASVHPEHEYLMLDHEPIHILDIPFLRTRQWSQRPHLASTKFYRYIADKFWDDEPRFIEHIMYGIVVDGDYDEFRLHVYAPEGTLVRSLHTDGRRRGADHYDPTAS